MEDIRINVKLFGDKNNNLKVLLKSGSSLIDLIEKMNQQYFNIIINYIKKNIIDNRDLSSCVVMYNEKRLYNYEELCTICLKEGDIITFLPPIIGG
jgi:molybdopterin converting factor small subunit